MELIYLNDGEIDDRRKEVMMRTGEVITGDMGLSGSYMRAKSTSPAGVGGQATTLFTCARKTISMMPVLLAASRPQPLRCRPTTSASTHRWMPESRTETRCLRPAFLDDGARGVKMPSSRTSTGAPLSIPQEPFVARMDALRRDAWVHRVGCKTPGAFDHSICLAYQGYVPFSSKSLLHDLVADNGPFVRRIRVGLYDVALDILALRASLNHHILLGVTPALACHLEDGCLAAGVDWEKIAVDTDVWAAQSGFRSLLEIG